DTVFFGDQGETVLRRIADLGHPGGTAREIFAGFQPGRPSLVGGDQRVGLKARRLMDETADDAQRTLAREIVETAGEGGRAEIEIARGDAEDQRLLRRERHQLDIEAFSGEVTLVLRDEDGRRSDRFENAESHMI